MLDSGCTYCRFVERTFENQNETVVGKGSKVSGMEVYAFPTTSADRDGGALMTTLVKVWFTDLRHMSYARCGCVGKSTLGQSVFPSFGSVEPCFRWLPMTRKGSWFPGTTIPGYRIGIISDTRGRGGTRLQPYERKSSRTFSRP